MNEEDEANPSQYKQLTGGVHLLYTSDHAHLDEWLGGKSSDDGVSPNQNTRDVHSHL